MSKQGLYKIKIVIRQPEWHAFWWPQEFVSIELFKVKNCAKSDS